MTVVPCFSVRWHCRLAVILFLLVGSGWCARGQSPRKDKTTMRRKFPTSKYIGASANVSDLLDALVAGYDRRLRPNYKGAPVEVGVTMHIASVSSISEVDMDFTLDMYFRQQWKDTRLTFEASEGELCIGNEMLEKIWWPDTFFANAKKANFHMATTRNAFLRIMYTGEILLSLRLTVNAMCPMDLMYFPMDSQKCSLEIESYGYSTKDINYHWKGDDPVTISEDVQLPQFKVGGHSPKSRTQALSTGNYTRLSCEFYFVRSLGYYVIQIYVPSLLIVVLSWVSFWLSREAVPARVALGITTVLTMTTLISSTNASLPKISYLKSIDVYLVTCFVMVFASLLEYAGVSYISNRQKQKQSKLQLQQAQGSPGHTSDSLLEKSNPANRSPIMLRKNSMGGCEGMDPVLATEVRLTSLRKLHTECDLRSNLPPGSVNFGTCRNNRMPDDMRTETQREKNKALNWVHQLNQPSLIDKYSRILFPLVFLIFNLMYWITYLNISSVKNPEDYETFGGG